LAVQELVQDFSAKTSPKGRGRKTRRRTSQTKRVNIPTVFIERLGLFDTNGMQILPSVYDGITQQSADYLHLLQKNKFGLYSPKQNLVIKPCSDLTLQPLVNNHWIFNKGQSKGVINNSGDTVLTPIYADYKLWNDTSAWFLQDKNWVLLAIKSGKVVSDSSYNRMINFQVTSPVEKWCLLQTKASELKLVSSLHGQITENGVNDIFWVRATNRYLISQGKQTNTTWKIRLRSEKKTFVSEFDLDDAAYQKNECGNIR
jgi:hypothetical protein